LCMLACFGMLYGGSANGCYLHIRDQVLTERRTLGKFLRDFQTLLTELNREPGANPGRARRCNRGQTLHEATAICGKAQLGE
jgi:hypothetical protein